MTKALLLIISGIFIIVLLIYFGFNHQLDYQGKSIHIIDRWELPEVLEEVSGISYIGNNLMACIQDEDGIIFIYNLEKRKIEQEIEFAGAGDYESISVAGSTAYVLRSDGTIYEVSNFLSSQPVIKTLYTHKVSGKNFEGLEYDRKNNRLLLSVKERSGKEFRPVYSFDLQTAQLEEEPVMKILFRDSIFSELGKKPSYKFLRPSEISIHPQTGKIFLLEGNNPKVLILNKEGVPEKIHLLSRKQFRQAEGLTLGENGEIFISNEGNGTPPNILQISLN